MNERLIPILKFSILAVLVASIGPIGALIGVGFHSDYTWQYSVGLMLFPFLCLSVYFSLKGSLRALFIWFGILAYYSHMSMILLRGASLMSLLSYLSFALLLYCIVRGLIFMDTHKVQFDFSGKFLRNATIFNFLLNIILILGPIILMFYILYLTEESHLRERMDLAYFVEHILAYDGWAISIYFLTDPTFLRSRPEIDVFILIPLYSFTIYLLLRQNKWGYITSIILLAKQGASILMLIIPGVFKILKESFNNILEFFRHPMTADPVRYELPRTIIEIKLVLFFVIALLSVMLLIPLLKGLRGKKGSS